MDCQVCPKGKRGGGALGWQAWAERSGGSEEGEKRRKDEKNREVACCGGKSPSLKPGLGSHAPFGLWGLSSHWLGEDLQGPEDCGSGHTWRGCSFPLLPWASMPLCLRPCRSLCLECFSFLVCLAVLFICQGPSLSKSHVPLVFLDAAGQSMAPRPSAAIVSCVGGAEHGTYNGTDRL